MQCLHKTMRLTAVLSRNYSTIPIVVNVVGRSNMCNSPNILAPNHVVEVLEPVSERRTPALSEIVYRPFGGGRACEKIAPSMNMDHKLRLR